MRYCARPQDFAFVRFCLAPTNIVTLLRSVIAQVEGGSPRTVHAGFYESPTDVHVVSRNASGTQPAKLLVFYVKTKVLRQLCL